MMYCCVVGIPVFCLVTLQFELEYCVSGVGGGCYRVRCCCHDEDVVVLIVECGFVLCSSGDSKNVVVMMAKKSFLLPLATLMVLNPSLHWHDASG